MDSRRRPGRRGPGHRLVPGEKAKDRRYTLSRLGDYFKEEKNKLFLTFLLVLISGLIGIFIPFLIGRAIDIIYPGLDAVDFKRLKTIASILLTIYVLDNIFKLLQDYLVVGISQRIVYNIRKELFNKFQSLPIIFFDTTTHGELMSRITNDIDNISTTISQSTIQLMSSIVNIVGSLTMMLYLSVPMTLASMLTIPLVYLLTKTITKRTRVLFKEQQVSLGNLNSHIEETIGGISVVKAFGKEEKVVNDFIEENNKLRDIGYRAQIWSGFLMPIMNVIGNFGFAVIAAFGGLLAVRGQISVGIISSFIFYSKQFSRPLMEVAATFNTLQSGIAGAERVIEILDEEEERKDGEDAIEAEEIKGEVEFRQVDFEYEPGQPVLKDVSFKIDPGTNIALVGPTGAGKTTIVNLLTGFYEVEKGEILIDGVNIRDYKKDSLRNIFGMVLQDTYLFSGPVEENIRYGKLDASREEIIRAAEMSRAHDFISRLGEGYDTELTEGGSNLSQGQRQLLAISRAILADPSILILDEATSSVDTRTEFQIQEAMVNLMKDRTTFIIAHRLSTIRDADIIMVIDDGRIIEAGNHDQLLEKKGHYYELYRSQFLNIGEAM